ncbi:hypothetical protein [Fretibacter rubidus]|uniref:hypothetical protein n=1 Tax=Fretibacter rubidus TaxID=570162 RepID=UPI00352B27B0
MTEAIDPLKLAGAKPKGKRPYFLKDPDVERVLAVTMALAQEVAVMRERLDTVERILEEKGTLSQSDIEAYNPPKPIAEARGSWTQEYLARVLRIYQQEIEALDNVNEPSSEDIGHELGAE